MTKYLDLFLNWLGTQGPLGYLVLFAIVFSETGLVFAFFLPGDSLLFAVGTFVTRPGSPLAAPVVYPLLIAAALIGDNVNYHWGKRFGRALFRDGSSRLFRRDNLEKTEAFFAKYGGKAVILARFVPIVRTFAPFVAGMGAMPYPRFLAYSIAGAILWVGTCVTAGIVFGQIPFVKKNFELVILAIIAVSVLPMVHEYRMHRRASIRPDQNP